MAPRRQPPRGIALLLIELAIAEGGSRQRAELLVKAVGEQALRRTAAAPPRRRRRHPPLCIAALIDLTARGVGDPHDPVGQIIGKGGGDPRYASDRRLHLHHIAAMVLLKAGAARAIVNPRQSTDAVRAADAVCVHDGLHCQPDQRARQQLMCGGV